MHKENEKFNRNHKKRKTEILELKNTVYELKNQHQT